MTNEQIVSELRTIKNYFIQTRGACPLCIIEAITIIQNIKEGDNRTLAARSEEVRSPLGHKHEIIKMLRKDTECPYSACAKAYERALEYLRCGGDV